MAPSFKRLTNLQRFMDTTRLPALLRLPADELAEFIQDSSLLSTMLHTT